MRETTVARNYAEALLELARDDDAIEDYSQTIHRIADLIETERDFRRFLDTPRVEVEEKKAAIREVFESQVPGRLLRFLYVVIDKRRQRLIPSIASEFTDLVNEHFGRLQVGITVAREPDESFRQRTRERLERAFQKEILAQYRVEPRILGGIIVRVGDRVMDGSLRRRLQSLRRSLLKTEFQEAGEPAG